MIYYSFTHLFVCVVLRRLIELIIKNRKHVFVFIGMYNSSINEIFIWVYNINFLVRKHRFYLIIKRDIYRIYSDKCYLFWPRSCLPHFFCLFHAHETIAFALLELGLLSIFNQDHRMCVYVREDDKSIIGLLCSASETEAVITITF